MLGRASFQLTMRRLVWVTMQRRLSTAANRCLQRF